MIKKIVKYFGSALLWSVITLLLAVVFAPAFLDRIYYQGPATSHYDGTHFSNPDGAIDFPVPPGERRGNLIYRFLLGSDDRPDWPDQVTVKPAKPNVRVSAPGEMRATWVGHATVLVQAAGLNILTDPQWSDYASPFPGIGPKRVAPPGVRFEDLPKIDIVLVSHNHYDHMDLPTLKRLWERDRPLIVTSLGNDRVIAQAGVRAQALDWGGMAERAGARVHVVRNHHWSSRWGRDRNRALWSAFVVETAAGNIFFAGDTGLGDGKWPVEARKYGPIRLALIPIGAFRFYPGQMWNDSHIGPQQAVEVFEKLGATMAVPIHWGTFRLSNEGYDTPPRMLGIFTRCAGIDPGAFHPLHIGEQVLVPEKRFSPTRPHNPTPADCRPGSTEISALK